MPLTIVAGPHITEQDARFSFALPGTAGDPVVVHLRYVEERMPPGP